MRSSKSSGWLYVQWRNDYKRSMRHQPTLSLAACIVIVAALYVGAAVALTKLVENRGVGDDVCYLRQAHLFRDRGFLKGLNTDSDDAHYLSDKFIALKLPDRFTPLTPCESYAPGSGRVFIQYPFGTGLLLSFFPQFAQSSWLYVASATLVFMLVCAALLTSRSLSALITVAIAGGANVYMMVNPSKASYSIAPTMPVCIVLGLLTVWMFAADRAWQRVVLAAAAGFLLGVAVDLRLSSALLAFGFAATFAAQFLFRRNWENFLRPAAFGASCVFAVLPLIASNVINGGSPFATGYRGNDVQFTDLSLSELLTRVKWYGSHTHGILLWSAVALLIVFIIKRHSVKLNGVIPIIGVVASNLIFNMGYFLVHPILAKYYTIAPIYLTIWTIVFAWRASERSQPLNSGRDWEAWASPWRIRIWFATALACGLAVFLFANIYPALSRKSGPGMTTISLEHDAVIWTSGEVWENPASRALEIYMNRHAVANFDTAIPETVNALIASIAKDGRPQYFIIDGPAMAQIANRAAAFGRVQQLGEILGYETERLDAVR